MANRGIQLASQAVPTQVNFGVGGPSKASQESGIHGEAIGAGAFVRWGPSVDMTVAQLKAKYPTHADYVAKVKKVTNEYRQGLSAQGRGRWPDTRCGKFRHRRLVEGRPGMPDFGGYRAPKSL